MKNKLQNNVYSDQYLIYNRKSTDDANSQKNSLAYQRQRNLEYVQREHLPLAKSLTIPGFCTNGIIDESHSAFKVEEEFIITSDGSIQYRILRTKFMKLVEMLNGGAIKGVVFLCWDRASRNDQDNLIIKTLINADSDIRFADAIYEKSSAGNLHMSIDGIFSGHYSSVISEKVKNAQEKLRSEGRCIYFSPIGYLDHGSDNKPFDPERAPIVKRIFELYATGEWSFEQLGKWAREQGLTTKPVRRKRTKTEKLNNVSLETIPKTSRPADRKTIEYILGNPFFIGKIRTKGGYTDGNFHQPLIDIGLYNKVQGVLKKHNVSVHYIDKDFFTYRGLLRCVCSRGFSPYRQKGINYYRTRCNPDCVNPDKNLTETDVHDLIKQALAKIHFTDDEIKEIEIKAKTELGVIANKRNKELDDLHGQRKKAFADLDYLINNKLMLLRTNTMSVADIKTEEVRFNQKIDEIDAKIKLYAESAQEMLNYVVTFSELVKNAALYYEFALDSEKLEIITQVFSELVFNDRKLVKWRAKEGFEALLSRNWVSGSPSGTALEPYIRAFKSYDWAKAFPAPELVISQTQQLLNYI